MDGLPPGSRFVDGRTPDGQFTVAPEGIQGTRETCRSMKNGVAFGRLRQISAAKWLPQACAVGKTAGLLAEQNVLEGVCGRLMKRRMTRDFCVVNV